MAINTPWGMPRSLGPEVPSILSQSLSTPEVPNVGATAPASDLFASLSNWGKQIPGMAGVASAPTSLIPNPMAGLQSFGGTPGGGNSLWDLFVGTTEKPGIGGMALGGLQAAGGAFLGMKQYSLAKKALEEGKRQFNLNYDAQKSTTNAQLEDRQRARVASNGSAYQSVGDYMNRYGIK